MHERKRMTDQRSVSVQANHGVNARPMQGVAEPPRPQNPATCTQVAREVEAWIDKWVEQALQLHRKARRPAGVCGLIRERKGTIVRLILALLQRDATPCQ